MCKKLFYRVYRIKTETVIFDKQFNFSNVWNHSKRKKNVDRTLHIKTSVYAINCFTEFTV